MSMQSRMTRRLQTCKRSDRQRGSLAASQAVYLHKAPVRFPAGENERKQVMLCLPLRSPLATELLIR
jgi:hypothetical protein